MILLDFIHHFVKFALFLGNALVFMLTLATYQRTGKRCLLLIAISAGIGGTLAVASWIRRDGPSWTFWGFWTVATLSDMTLWVIGIRLLVREYVNLVTRDAQPCALPNGGSEEPIENSSSPQGLHR